MRNKAGARLPWVYHRRLIAKEWGILPWEVDLWPTDELETELKILAIEAKHPRSF